MPIEIDTADPLFEKVVEEAKRAAGGDEHWCKAINRAVAMLEGNPYVSLDAGRLLVMSDTSAETYLVSEGSCECRAFREFRLSYCKHRVCRRLLLRYAEERERAEREKDSDGAVETSGTVEGPLPVRRYYRSSGEWETRAGHGAWCVGCADCWPMEVAA